MYWSHLLRLINIFVCYSFQIISDLLHFKGSHKHEFDSRWKSFNLVKKSMENRVRHHMCCCSLVTFVLWLSSSKCTSAALLILVLHLMFKINWRFKVYGAFSYLQLHGRKQHIRALLIDRVMLQHEVSFQERNYSFDNNRILQFLTLNLFCFISCGNWQWKDVSTGAFTRSWWEICWGFPPAPTVKWGNISYISSRIYLPCVFKICSHRLTIMHLKSKRHLRCVLNTTKVNKTLTETFNYLPGSQQSSECVVQCTGNL